MSDLSRAERDENGFLVPGTRVAWVQWGSGDRKVGTILRGYNGIYGPTYLCRARGWNRRFSTKVVETDLTLVCPVCFDTGLTYDKTEKRDVPCGGIGCSVVGSDD